MRRETSLFSLSLPFALFALLALFAGTLSGDEPAAKKEPANPFFVLDNGINDAKHATWDAKAKTLAELGYDGIGPSGTAGVPDMLAAMDKHGLKVSALYVGANLDPDQPKYDPKLPEVIGTLKGRPTFIWLYVLSRAHKRGTDEGDARAVEIVRELAGLCQESGIEIALYPHTGFYVERVEDAVRVARKADRPNVGVTFNLCHWLKCDGPKDLQAKLDLARPYLKVVTINGADSDGRDWAQLIQPLDRGTLDNYTLLAALREMGFKGPIGLQCYAVPGDKEENLRRSIGAWKKLQSRLSGP